jgi:hypothetical protein
MLTPLHVEIMLWYNSRAEDMENLRAPAVNEYLRYLMAEGMITAENAISTRSYKLTEKGQVWLEAVLRLPFPVQRWEIPS